MGADKLNPTTDPAHSAQTAIELVATVESTLFPAYRRAVDALDAVAAMELAAHVVEAVRRIEHGQKLVSTALSMTPDAAELRGLDGTLRGQFKLLQLELLTKIGPQYFRGAPVAGELEVPHAGKSVPDYLAFEAGTMVELLAVVKQADGIAGTGAAMTDATALMIRF